MTGRVFAVLALLLPSAAVLPAAPQTSQPGVRVAAAPPMPAAHPHPAETLTPVRVAAVGEARRPAPAIGDAATLDRSIPFGTKLRVLGNLDNGRHIDQTFVVTDRIGHGSDLDLYAGGVGDPGCEPRVDRTWGLQHLDVQVIR